MNKIYGVRLLLFQLFVIILMLPGCGDNALNFQIRFAEIAGLRQDAPVFFDGNNVGQVKKIIYTKKGDYLVAIAIAPEFTNAATVESKFFISINPQDPQSRAVTIVQDHPGGQLLQENSIVEGAGRLGYLDKLLGELQKTAGVAEDELREALEQLKTTLDSASQQVNSELEATLDTISRQFQAFKKGVREVPDRQEVKQLEESIKHFVEQFNRAQGEAQDYLRKEVIPQIKKELDNLREQLKKEGRQNEMEEIDHQMNEVIVV